MAPQEQLIQLQSQSDGIKPDLEAEGWHICHYRDSPGHSHWEEYYFPCSDDRECCGRECCVPVTGGFPLWLLILLSVLGFLLLLVVVLCVVYYCWKYCCKRTKSPTPPVARSSPVVVHPPPPKVEMYKRVGGGSLRPIRDDNLIEMKPAGETGSATATRPKRFQWSGEWPIQRNRRIVRKEKEQSTATDSSPVVSITTPTSNSERETTFVPSPMEVTYETAPKPIPVQHHDYTETKPLLSLVDTPKEQKARMEYTRIIQ